MRYRRNSGFRHLPAVLEGLLLPAGGAFLLAGLTVAFGVLPLGFTAAAADLFWWGGAFVSGRRAGLRIRHRGALHGVFCGVLLCVVLFAGMAFLYEVPGRVTAVRCIGMLLCGAGGGVLGVNQTPKRPPQ